jgi:Concanavalin A-like lectin/glucanases superfamily
MSRDVFSRPVLVRFLLLAVAASACLLSLLVLTTKAAAATYSPVAAYSFDEGEAAGTTIEDLAGENDGTIEGVERTTRGRYGRALSFHGIEGECASVPNSESLQLKEEFTIEAWVKSDSLVGEPIVYKETEGYYSYWFGIALGEEGHPEATIAGSKGGEWDVEAPDPIEPGVWTHLAVTYDGARLRLFVNGEKVASSAAPGATLESEGPLWIGCAPPNHETFEGRIDELHIYDRVLGQTDIAADMEAPIETPRSGPVADYSFDEVETEGETETVEDLSGHEHTATIEGPTSAPGRYGASLKFDGEHDCVSIESDAELELSEEFALEAWVRPEGEGLHGIVTQEDESAAESEDPFAYALLSGDEEGEGPRVWVRNPSGGRGHAGGPPVAEGAWSHLAVTDDGGRLRFYVDGELTDTEPAVPLTTGKGPLTIGCIALYGDHFKGRIDEVRVYDRALNAGEVAADMEAPIQTPRKSPVAEYSFDEVQTEGETQTVEDLSGDGHTATLHGATWTGHGRYGGALEFDAEEEAYVSIPADAGLDGHEELTVEAWVRPSDNTFLGEIAMKEREGPGAGYSWTLDQHASEPVGYFMQSEEGMVTGGEHSLPLHTWTHVAMTDDGAHDRLYVDGQLVDTAPAIPFDGHGPIKIGGNSLFGQWFDGRIDEVRVYERALNGAEVAADMESPLQTPKATPVAQYSFDEDIGETVEDQAGENDGTVEGAEWIEHGRYGGAMKFDGEAMVTIPASEDLNLSEEFTLEAWIRPEAGCEFGQIFVKEDAEEDHAAYVVSKHGSKLGAYLGVPGVEEESPNGSLEIGAWQHIAVTFDGSKARLYVDGEEVGSAPVDEILSTSGDLRLGGSHIGSHGGGFVGRIDEVRIYGRSLNTSEVAIDMETPIQTPKWGPIAAWSFDEMGEENTAEDLTGDGHTATIEGATTARGKFGESLQFDGEDDVVKVPNSPELALTEEFTVESWVRPESESNEWAPILAKEMGGGEATNELAWWLYEGDWNANEPFGGTEPSPGVRDEAHADDPLPVDSWSYVALSYDGAKVRLYVDGELVDCSPVPAGPPPITEGDLQIGGATELGTFFKGRIDEVRIYNRALSEGEVQQLMNAQFPTANTEPVTEEEANSAILAATVGANGAEAEYFYEVGTTEALGTLVVGEELEPGSHATAVSEAAVGLEPETNYYARAVVRGLAGTARGKILPFATKKRLYTHEEEEEIQIAEQFFHLTHKAETEPPANFYGVDWQSYQGLIDKMETIKSSEAHFVRFKAYPNPNLIHKARPEEVSEEEWVKKLVNNSDVNETFETAQTKGLAVVPYIGDGAWPKLGTNARNNYLLYAKAIVERFGPGTESDVTHWEIWNEPNMKQQGGEEFEGEVSPKQFGTFFKEMADAIHKGAKGELTILSPGLFGYRVKPEDCAGKCPRTPREFLSVMDTAPGAEQAYDAVSLHPYVFKVGQKPNRHAPRNNSADIALLRQTVRQDIVTVGTTKPIWVTEIGFPVEKTESADIPKVGGQVQKKLLNATFAMMQNQHRGLRVQHVIFYNIQDTKVSKANEESWEHHCGLFTEGGNPRPAWEEFVKYAKTAG